MSRTRQGADVDDDIHVSGREAADDSAFCLEQLDHEAADQDEGQSVER
ncbi:MAG: hypothetical protein AB1Z63_11485 [Candidatus Limnocylindrales bacterium]